MRDQELSLLFKAMNHEIRREILDLLKEGRKTTGELDAAFPTVTRYAVMKHLKILEEANLVLIRREGRMRYNYLNVVPLQQLYERWVTKYQGESASSLIQFKNIVEGEVEQMEKKIDSFQIEQEVTINAPREKVFQSLTSEINKWWAYRLLGPNSSLHLDPVIGGAFIEKGDNDNGALWGTVTFINPPEELRLQGLLGMKGSVHSAYSYRLIEKGNSTVLQLSHQAMGFLEPHWHEAHENGWKELLGTFLKDYVEKGVTPSK